MKKNFNIFISRFIIRLIGKNCRYFYYKIIGQPRTLDRLSNTMNKEKDYLAAIDQDFYNVLIGMIVITVSIYLAIWLI